MSIKRTALALGSALMLFANTLSAQEQPWSFGVKAGASMSWLQGAEGLFPTSMGSEEFKYKASGRIGLSGGLTSGYAFHENLGLGLEVLYAGLGSKVKKTKDSPTDSDKPTTYRIYSDNLVVPVMLKWFPMGHDPEEGILSINLGVQGVMPLRPKFESKEGDKDFEKMKDIQDTAKEVVRSFGLDGIAGVSYEFPGTGLAVEGRYHLGIMTLLKNDAKENMGIENSSNLRSHYATLSLEYNFARLLMD